MAVSDLTTKFKQDEKLQLILNKLIPVFQPTAIYLFGSKARGDAGPDSDYDLLLLVSDDAPKEKKRSWLAYETLCGTGIAADILILTESAFQKRLHVVASLPATVKREGKLLYAA